MNRDKVERLLLTIPEAAEAIGVCRAKGYQLAKSGELPSIKIGNAVRVPVKALQEWLQRKEQEAEFDFNA